MNNYINDKLARLNGVDKKLKVAELKNELATYDYIGVKIATGVATKEEYAEQIRYCESLREKIRALED